eukprot:gene10512-11617_t
MSSVRCYEDDMISQLLATKKRPGRPAYDIPAEILEELRGLGMSWDKIAGMLNVSRWTIQHRVQEYSLEHLHFFSELTDEAIDEIISDYINRHGNSTGETYLRGHFTALGLRVQQHRMRKSLTKVDLQNTALRWGNVVSRITYFVPWPNSLWHPDAHHSLIRWGVVIHGCINGKTRRIIFLHAANNNLANTVLTNFEDAIRKVGGCWPSRIRVDFGVENTAVCNSMVVKMGEGRGSFIAGSSTRNQRIERLWRDVFRCVCHIFYYTFYGLEQSGLLNVENNVHIFTLHFVYLQRINHALDEWLNCHNNHPLSTEQGWSPNQLWLAGMANPLNPLSEGNVDDDPDDLTYYG